MVDIENVESFAEYRQYINELCDIIENEYDIKNSEDPYNIIHENVDSTKAIMYYSYNMTILNYSDSEPHEWQIYVEDNEKDYKKVLQGMAYATLQYDITMELSDRGLLD